MCVRPLPKVTALARKVIVSSPVIGASGDYLKELIKYPPASHAQQSSNVIAPTWPFIGPDRGRY
jgi:hypothetical protein